MDIIWILVAFVGGFIFKQFNYPPLIGYLFAGFILNAAGFQQDSFLQDLADIGVTMLLFVIGLKIHFKSLLKTEVWGGALGHMALNIALMIGFLLGLGSLGFVYFTDIDLQTAALVGFALSFSSTVVVVKILEDNGEIKSRHGQLAVGILVIQDIAAVLFLTIVSGKSPTVWVVGLLALPLARPLLGKLLQYSGHGELLPLSGFLLALSGGALFEIVGLKADLGALVFGILLSSDKKSSELARSLLVFKDLFLIGFFLSIGFTALPTVDMWKAALVVALLLPLKSMIYFFLLCGLRLRGRTAFLTALCMGNYSEFGLIVAVVSVSSGLLSADWLVIMALAVSISFVLASMVNAKSHTYYAYWKNRVRRFELQRCLDEDTFSQLDGAKILIVGMGRVGTGAYDSAIDELGEGVWGVDSDMERVEEHLSLQRHVSHGDAEGADFWENIALQDLELIMLAVPSVNDAINVYEQLQLAGYSGRTSALVKYDDDRQPLLDKGVDVVFNLYAEAGAGFAHETFTNLKML